MKIYLYFVFCFFILTSVLFGERNIFGKWTTYDDKQAGLKKSIVEIYKQNGQIYGKIVELFNVSPEKGDNPICNLCKGSLQNQPIKGMIVLRDLKYNEDMGKYISGRILDPENGKEYNARLWLEQSKKSSKTLKVRGYIGFFFRTQTWKKNKDK